MRRRCFWPLSLILIAATAAAPPELPPLNARVAAFARDHLGKPVGDGICTTLAIEALREAGAKPAPLDEPDGQYRWGTPVDSLADALPGDILQFQDAVFEWKQTTGRRREYWHLEYKHHTAIVAKVADRGRLVTILHQNVETRGQDPARKGDVQETTLRMGSLRPGGTVRAYRPMERPSKGEPRTDGEGPGPDR
ncbi:hypothetical protein TA3x_000719 [Tundrisphaera sp. TA3]|uniref:hypothetical protein n=1 Tax=Tundrisphaera sp. TA3 TaxID=3435775 RepID=UPI003EBB9308